MRSAEGEDHLGHAKISIDEHEDKLNLMKEKLIAAEVARRQGLSPVGVILNNFIANNDLL